jgi:2'-5' RNA ligase
MEESAQQYFNKMRRSYFTAERNYLDAHLTLFHSLPDEIHIYEYIRKLCRTEKVFIVNVEAIVSLGYGTAIKVAAPTLHAIHQRCRTLWLGRLTPQDKQKLWPHVTIQNKVDADTARDLQMQLKETFKQFTFQAFGLQLWRYLGDAWEPLDQFKFQER